MNVKKRGHNERLSWIKWRKSVLILGLLVITIGIWQLWLVIAPHNDSRSTPPQVDLRNSPLYKHYRFGASPKIINFGIQPLWVPCGLETEVIRRDILLKEELAALGVEVRFFSFLKGVDVNYFFNRGDLQVAVGGDMPAITAAVQSRAFIPALMDLNFTTIVARESILMSDLRGKRIGYAYGSNAHYTLLKALTDANLTEDDLFLIPMDINQMPQALQNGKIDAFSAWEPTPTIVGKLFRCVPINKNMSTGYMWFSRQLLQQHPQVIKQILAAQIRALHWLGLSWENLVRASRWSIEAGSALSKQPSPLSPDEYAAMAQVSLQNIASIPLIPEKDFTPQGRIGRIVEFLKKLGKIPKDTQWHAVQDCLDREMTIEVLSNPTLYRLNDVQYSEVDR